MDCVFIDIETTGRNPLQHQMYEFAAVPVINGFIRKDLMWHTYIQHRTYKIEVDILPMVSERLANPKPGVPSIWPDQWGGIFKKKLKTWVELPATFGGKNFGSFDWQFLLHTDGSLRFDNNLSRYSYLDIGNLIWTPEEKKIPSLSRCREIVIAEGAPISVENTHYADDDALLCAEIYVWESYARIMYAEPHPNGQSLRVFHPNTRNAAPDKSI